MDSGDREKSRRGDSYRGRRDSRDRGRSDRDSYRSRDDSRDRRRGDRRDSRDRNQRRRQNDDRSRSRSPDRRRKDQDSGRKRRSPSPDSNQLSHRQRSPTREPSTSQLSTNADDIAAKIKSESRFKDHPENISQEQPKQPPPKQDRWGRQEEYDAEAAAAEEKVPEYKPDFGLSGALAKDERTGNVLNGIVLKFTEPYEAAKPDKHWRLYAYRGEELLETLHIHRRSCFLFGRDDRVADIPILHPSSSLQHAVIQFRAIDERKVIDGERVTVSSVKPYLMDLKSTHGTWLNSVQLEDSRYYELREGDVLKFGNSSREFVLLHDQSGKDE